jgi:hypothetical protein
MTLALDACDLDQGALVDHRRPPKQRPGDRDLVLARKLPDQGARRIAEDGQSFRQISARGQFGARNETDQNASVQRLGSPCLTISSSPGTSDAATVIKRTQNRRIGASSTI